MALGCCCATLLSGVAQGKADPARPPHVTRTVSPGASLPHPPVAGPTAGEGPGRRRAVTHADRWSRARWRVRCEHHPTCGAVVVAPGSGSRVAGVVRWPALGPMRLPGSSLASPALGARARRGRGALCPAPAHGVVSCPAEGRAAGSGGGGRRSRQRCAPAASGTHQGGIALPGGRAGHGGSHTLHLGASCGVSRHHPRPTGWCGIRRPGWYPRGGRRSVTGKPGHPRRFPATQQGLAGDGE